MDYSLDAPPSLERVIEERRLDTPSDVLKGAKEIAAFLGESRRVVYYQISNGMIPVYRMGDCIRARKSTLLAWMSEQETASVGR